MKLIKLKSDHFIIVDDSEVKPHDFIYSSVTNKITKFTDPRHFSDGTYWKITHSTQPLEHGTEPFADGVQYVKIYYKIKPISLQEVKELIGEVDVAEIAYLKKLESSNQDKDWIGYGKGVDGISKQKWKEIYSQAIEDNKEKKYTEEDVIDFAIWRSTTVFDPEKAFTPKGKFELWRSLQLKTEWDVEIVDNKLKLK